MTTLKTANEGTVAADPAQDVNQETVAQATTTPGKEGAASQAKPTVKKKAKVSRAKASKSATGEGASRMKPQQENGDPGPKSKPKQKTEAATSKPKTTLQKEQKEGTPLYQYIGAGICTAGLVGFLSFAILNYITFLNPTIYAYILGPLQSLGFILVTIIVYTLFEAVNFRRVLPWLWALGGLGMVIELNVFWPSMYTELAIPSKLLAVLSFLAAPFFLKFFFRRSGRITAGKRNAAMTMMVVLFGIIGSIVPLTSEFSYLLHDQLYAIFVEGMPTIGSMVLWPLDYFGIYGEIGISSLSAYGSFWNDELVVEIVTAILNIASNMVTYAAIAFILGWSTFGRRTSPTT